MAGRGTISLPDVERYIARRGCTFIGYDEEDDIHAAFQVLDRNGNGRIDIDEFRRFMTTMGERMSADEVEDLIKCAKKEGQCFIEYKGNNGCGAGRFRHAVRAGS